MHRIYSQERFVPAVAVVEHLQLTSASLHREAWRRGGGALRAMYNCAKHACLPQASLLASLPCPSALLTHRNRGVAQPIWVHRGGVGGGTNGLQVDQQGGSGRRTLRGRACMCALEAQKVGPANCRLLTPFLHVKSHIMTAYDSCGFRLPLAFEVGECMRSAKNEMPPSQPA